MFLLDDLLFAPAKGLFALFKAVHEQATKEVENDESLLRQQLLLLHHRRDDARRQTLEAELLASLTATRRRAQP